MPHLPDITTQHSAFRLTEKHFKKRSIKGTTPSLHGHTALDLSRPEAIEVDAVWQAGWWGPEESLYDVKHRLRKGKERERGERGENDMGGMREVRLKDGRKGWVVAEGCILIPQYLSPSSQLQLLHSALTSYTLPPNPLSLSTHYLLPPDLFGLYTHAPDTVVQPIFASLPPEIQERIQLEVEKGGHSPRTLNETEAGSTVGYEEILKRSREWKGDVPGSTLGEKTVGELMRELRWANLGWVYRWTTKAYDFTCDRPIPFPEPLGDICSDIVRGIPWHDVFSNEERMCGEDDVAQAEWSRWSDDYRPDTGIVNFYQMTDTLMGHVDRAELDPSRPLVSISLGHAAVFLLGSTTRSDPPRPIILRSGDVLIMSGKGRQFYHGVPRIMENTLPTHFSPSAHDDAEMAAVKRYIATARVNINARQVFPPGFQRPDA